MAQSKPKENKSKKLKGSKNLFTFFKSSNKEVEFEPFEVGKYEAVKLNAGSLRFQYLYGRKRLWLRYALVIFLGVFMAVAVQFLVKNTGLYNSGVSAIAQGIARLTNTMLLNAQAQENIAKLVFNLLFWGLYVLFNLPLFFFGRKHIGKTFSWLTLVFLVTNSLVGISLSYIPGSDGVFLFGNTIAEGSGHAWNSSNNVFVEKGIYNIPFWYEAHLDSITGPNIIDQEGKIVEYASFRIFNPDYDPYKAILLFIYSMVYGIVCSVVYASIYIIGGSGGGTDFIAIYFSSVKHKPLGGITILFNSSCLIIGSVIGSYISAGLVDPQGFNFPFLLSANLVASFIYVVVTGLLLNRFYPLHRIVKVEVMSTKIHEIRTHLFEHKFTHSLSISKNIGAYSLQEKEILWTICMYIETPKLIRHISKVDPEALIMITSVLGVDGKIKLYRQGSTER